MVKRNQRNVLKEKPAAQSQLLLQQNPAAKTRRQLLCNCSKDVLRYLNYCTPPGLGGFFMPAPKLSKP